MAPSSGQSDRGAPDRRVVYINARLLNPASGLDAPGALLVEGRKIADFGPELFRAGVPEGIDTVDCGGCCLAPGLIDMRVSLCEPGEEHKETFASASAAAAVGGVTGMVCLPNTNPPIDNVALVEFVARRARETGIVKIHAYATVTKGFQGQQLSEMGLLAEAGALAFTDGRVAVANPKVMRRALSYARTFGLLIIQHPEEPTLAADGAMNESETSARLGLQGIPPVAEVMMIERDLRLVEITGGRYHVAHVTTAAAIEAIRDAKSRGLRITCDTAPQYFTLNETAIGDYRTFGKMSPPLRSEEDRLAVLEAVCDGTIDAIASDHTPQDTESKRQPFALAEDGMVGLETLLPLCLAPVHDGKMGLLDMLGRITHRPADIVGLREGRLGKGLPADFFVFDPGRPWMIVPDLFISKSKNSPFDGHPVQGMVLRTVVGGRTVFERDRS